jgi:hypothetical protein
LGGKKDLKALIALRRLRLPARYRLAKIWLRRARGSELISKVPALRPLGSHHFRVAHAPKEDWLGILSKLFYTPKFSEAI